MQIVKFEYNELIYRRDTFVETGKISLENILQEKGHLKTEDALNLLKPVVFYLAGLHRRRIRNFLLSSEVSARSPVNMRIWAFKF